MSEGGKGVEAKGPKHIAPRGQIPWPHGTHQLGPQGELGGGQVLVSFPSTENQPQVFFPNFLELSSCYPWISKFRADFSNLFGGITPWYVTPPPIQLLFVLMLFI